MVLPKHKEHLEANIYFMRFYIKVFKCVFTFINLIY